MGDYTGRTAGCPEAGGDISFDNLYHFIRASLVALQKLISCVRCAGAGRISEESGVRFIIRVT